MSESPGRSEPAIPDPDPATQPDAEGRTLLVKRLGVCYYLDTWQSMRAFTDSRVATSQDELWLLEHPPVFTLGQAGRREHILDAGNIPVIQTDRGGQVTYHGPGQLVAYVLLDLGRAHLGIKALVNLLEAAVIDLLGELGIDAEARPGAPGVYVQGAKIASLGLRVRRHCSYHGLALNLDMDLEPFSRINPCGYPGLTVTHLADFGLDMTMDKVQLRLAYALSRRLDRICLLENYD